MYHSLLCIVLPFKGYLLSLVTLELSRENWY